MRIKFGKEKINNKVMEGIYFKGNGKIMFAEYKNKKALKNILEEVDKLIDDLMRKAIFEKEFGKIECITPEFKFGKPLPKKIKSCEKPEKLLRRFKKIK